MSKSLITGTLFVLTIGLFQLAAPARASDLTDVLPGWSCAGFCLLKDTYVTSSASSAEVAFKALLEACPSKPNGDSFKKLVGSNGVPIYTIKDSCVRN